MAPTVFLKEICSPRERHKQDLKSIPWGIETPSVYRSIRKMEIYTGVKLALMPANRILFEDPLVMMK